MPDHGEATTPLDKRQARTVPLGPRTRPVDPAAPLITAPPDGARRVRGFEILNTLAFVRRRGGREGIVRVLRRLSPADLDAIGGGAGSRLHRFGWVPFGLHCRVMRAVDAELGRGDLSLLFDIGAFMVERDLPTLFRPLMKLGKPGWIIPLGSRMWRIYHHEGTWTVERQPYEILARLENLSEVDESYCLTFLGWLVRGMEMTGATDVQAHHPICMARGGMSCIFTGRWS